MIARMRILASAVSFTAFPPSLRQLHRDFLDRRRRPPRRTEHTGNLAGPCRGDLDAAVGRLVDGDLVAQARAEMAKQVAPQRNLPFAVTVSFLKVR